MAQKIKKDDMVRVIAGKDIDKEGKVIAVDRKKHRVIVEGCQHAYQTYKTKYAESGLAESFIRKDRLMCPNVNASS